MKRITILVMVLSILFPGCWDLTESDKLGLVTLMGVDSSADGQVKVLIHELSHQEKSTGGQNGGGGGGKSPVKLHEASAISISEAMQKINASSFRRTFFSHANAIVFSEEVAASRRIGPFIDFFGRNPDIRRNTWLLIAKKREFEKIFSTGANVEPDTDTGKVIREILENRPVNSFLSANTLGDFLDLYWEAGSEPYTSGIGLVEIISGRQTEAGGGDRNDSNIYDIKIQNTAAFKEDMLAGWLDIIESTGLLWAKGRIKGGTIPLNYDNKEISLTIIKAGSKMRPAIIDGKLQIDIRINVLSNIGESQADLDFSSKEVIENIQNFQAKEIKKQILAALNKSKQLNSDVFGFGNLFFGEYPEYWKQIESTGYNYYPDVEVSIEVKSTVNNIGLITKAGQIGGKGR